MAGHGWQWLELAKIPGNGQSEWKWLEMARIGWKWMEMDGNGGNEWKWLDMAIMVENRRKRLEIDEMSKK